MLLNLLRDVKENVRGWAQFMVVIVVGLVEHVYTLLLWCDVTDIR